MIPVRIYRVPLLALACALSTGALSAQSDAADFPPAPVAVLEQYRAALSATDWAGAAALVHPDDLTAFRGVVDALDDHPEGPALLAEWFEDPDGLGSLDDAELLGAYLQWLFAGQPGALVLMQTAEWTVDDVTVVGDRATVVATVSIATEADPLVVPDTTVMRRYDDRWRIDLSAAIAALRESLDPGGGGRR